MFGSGSKKQSASTTVWNIQILTTEYLVDGSLQPEKYEVGGQNIFERASQLATDEGGPDAFQRLRLSDVKVQPTGNPILIGRNK